MANRFYYQENIPRKDAAILANCPDRGVRRRWIRRIHDHDGTADGEGGIEAWLRLGEAVGLTREEMWDERHVVPGVRFAVDAYVTFARTRPWVEAVASSLTELFAPDLMAERLAAFERFYTWIDPAGLAYFRARLTQAPLDSEHALEVVMEHCRTPEEQARAVAALSFKNDVLWSMLDAIDRAYSDRFTDLIIGWTEHQIALHFRCIDQLSSVLPGMCGARWTGGDMSIAVLSTNRPHLARQVRLDWDPVREQHVLLAPEGVLVLNQDGRNHPGPLRRGADGRRDRGGAARTVQPRGRRRGAGFPRPARCQAMGGAWR